MNIYKLDLGIEKVNVSFDELIYEILKENSEKQSVIFKYFISKVIMNHLNEDPKLVSCAEKIKHFQEAKHTYISGERQKISVEIDMDKRAVFVIQKFADCRKMTISEWIEDHMDIAFQNRITPDKLNEYLTTKRNEPCPCGSDKKYKKCCASILEKGRKPAKCSDCSFTILYDEVYEREYECACGDSDDNTCEIVSI